MDESIAAGVPVDPAHGGLCAQNKPVPGEQGVFYGVAVSLLKIGGAQRPDAGDLVGGDGDGEFWFWDLWAYLAPHGGCRPTFSQGMGEEIAHFFEMTLGGGGGVLVFAEVGLAKSPGGVLGGECFVDRVEGDGVAGLGGKLFEQTQNEAMADACGAVDAFVGHVIDELLIIAEKVGGGPGGFFCAEHSGHKVVIRGENARFDVGCVGGDGAGGDGVEGGIDGGGVGVCVFYLAVGPQAGVCLYAGGELDAPYFMPESSGGAPIQV